MTKILGRLACFQHQYLIIKFVRNQALEHSMQIHHQLSKSGSDRATGYNMSSKIIRRDDTLFVTWLDAPPELGQPAAAMLGVCDLKSGELRKTIRLGEGIDNHCGAALALDGDGRLHAVIGAHGGDFLYRWSDAPESETAWSPPEPLGPQDTYPSLVVDAKGTLHLAHREGGERWQLWYRRKHPGGAWEPPKSLAISPVPGYNHYMQSLTVGPTGSLHLIFQFHYADSGHASDCRGRAAVHLQSDDGGDTWFNDGQRCDTLPLTVETMNAICRHEGQHEMWEVRVGNHVVDAENHPWFFASIPGRRAGVVWHRTDDGWQDIDLGEKIPTLNMENGRATSISRDADGYLHLIVATNPFGEKTPWFEPSLELFYLKFTADGSLIDSQQLTENDPAAANWLPSLEWWDWTRPAVSCADAPWFLYTCGLNAGGIGGDNRNSVDTAVYLSKPS
jgi:hypothetical protein